MDLDVIEYEPNKDDPITVITDGSGSVVTALGGGGALNGKSLYVQEQVNYEVAEIPFSSAEGATQVASVGKIPIEHEEQCRQRADFPGVG